LCFRVNGAAPSRLLGWVSSLVHSAARHAGRPRCSDDPASPGGHTAGDCKGDLPTAPVSPDRRPSGRSPFVQTEEPGNPCGLDRDTVASPSEPRPWNVALGLIDGKRTASRLKLASSSSLPRTVPSKPRPVSSRRARAAFALVRSRDDWRRGSRCDAGAHRSLSARSRAGDRGLPAAHTDDGRARPG